VRRPSVLLLLVVLLVGLIPGVAAAGPPRTAVRIDLSAGDQTLATGQPFYVEEGWTGLDHEDLKTHSFQLFVQGIEFRSHRAVSKTDGDDGERYWSETSIYTFREGLPTGPYYFTGVWTGPEGTRQVQIRVQILVSAP